ncbi:MAG TPA: hypothetical protein VFY18_00285 [Candidatus Limnocylindrales bacterium]|nr:hypothetical protein [Candidatus Limnocylindrales bacterium]
MVGVRAGAALVLAVTAFVASACGALAPSVASVPTATGTPTPGPGDRLPDREAAIARAISVAEIGGPFVVDEGIRGTFADLDVMAHNNVLGPPENPLPGSTMVWRVTLHGPNGSESIILGVADGARIGAISQGH